MKIGLLLPSILTAKRFEDRIFAPKELFLWLADGLVDRGHEVFVYGSSNIKTKARLISGNQLLEIKDYVSIKDVRKKSDIAAALTFERNLHEYEIELASRAFAHANEHKLDILHIYLANFSHYFVNFSKLPVLFTLHDPVFSENILEHFRLKLFNHHNYIAISDSQKKQYENLLQMKSVFTVYHGIKLENFTFLDNSNGYICLIGRYLPEKGFSDAIKTALQLKIPLKIASSKNYQEIEYYKKEIEPYLKSPLIREEGFLDPQSRSKLLGEAKILLFPVRWEEPFGMVMIEAMATGTPVVAYAQGSVPEVIKDGETGFIVNVSDDDIRGDWIVKKTGVEGLIEAVQRIYSMSEEEYKQMRRNCRAQVEQNFTVKKMVENYEKVYEKLIAT